MKSVGIFNALLRVLLSVALVVSFTPIPASAAEDATVASGSPSASVGEQGSALSGGLGEAALTGGAAVEVAGAAAGAGDVSSGSDAESPAGEASGAVEPAGEGGDTAADASSSAGEGAEAAASPEGGETGSNAADAASSEDGETGFKAAEAADDPAQRDAADAADDPAERAADDELAQQGVLYAFGKLMAGGYVYACDEQGNLTKPVDEDDPERNAISARDVTNLIIDYHVADIPKGLCEGSTSLTSVRFENDRLDSIGDFAFAACAKLSFISFSDMHIGSIGAQAFAGCSSLTSLSIKKPAEIGALGEGCFLKSGLESTGLGNVKGLTSIPADAYEGCQNLSNTGLGQNQQIVSVGNWAFANCPNLHLTGLETNTSVSQLGDGCFSGSNLDGGLILPSGSQIEELPSRTFADTNMDYAYFQCDHAVLIDVDTFPKRGMQVMVPSDMVGLYRSGFPELNWDGCNGATPVSVSECLKDLRIEHDPNVMEYAEDQQVSLAGMKVTFDHGYGRSSFDYEDLKNCAFAQFIEVYPDDGYLFRSSFHGQRIHMTYDDGEVYLDAYSAEPMRERGDTDLAVDIQYSGALSSGDSATGAGQYKPGETCVVVANATTPGRTFAYWTDEEGNILSEDQWYEFTVERDTLLTAVFADSAKVAPEVRLGSADGRQVIGAKASVLVDGRDMGRSFTTYAGKHVTLTCEYDTSKYHFDHWESSLDKHYLGSRPGDTIEYEAVAGETPIAVLVEYGQVNVSAKSASGLALGTVSGSGTYELGQTVKLSAIPANGCRFLGWMHHGELLSTEASYAYRVQDFDEVTGWFAFDFSQTWVAVRAASAQPDRGSVSGAGMYEEGTQVTLTATPNAGFAFSGWLCDGEPIEGGEKLVVTAKSADQTDALVKRSPLYTATFEPVACDIRYEQMLDAGGRTLMEGVEVPQVTGSLSTEGGQVVTLDAKALGMLDDDTVFTGWFDAATGERVCESLAYEFTPAGDTTLQVRFSLKEVGVHINPARTTDHSESYAHLQVDAANCYCSVGETVQLSATPDNAQFVGWYAADGDDSVAISDQATCEYKVAKPANESAQMELTPWYSAIPASVVLSVAGTDEDGNAPGYFLTSGLYGVGQQVTVNAVPEPGYVFDYATDALGNTVPAAPDGSYTFLLTGDTELVAHFRVAEDEDEAFEALQIALLAVLGTIGVVAAVYGLGEIVDPIIAQAMIDIAGAETIEELAQIGKNVLKEIKDIFDHHKHDNDPNKPHGDHSVEILTTAHPTEGGIVRGGGIHFEGTIAELEAIPNPGYRFVCWKEDGVERSVSQRMQIRITNATPEVVAMTAVFERNVRITTSAEVTGVDAGIPTGCNATPDVQTPRQGQEAKVIATEGEGYAFVGWFEDGIEVSKSPVYVFPAEVDRHLVAKFRKADRTIVVGADPDEGAQVLCDGLPVEGGVVRAADGDILTFTAVPAVRADDPEKKYKLVEWRKSDDSGRTVIDRGDVCEYRVDGNGRITAVMDGKDSHSVRAAADPVEGGTATLKNGESIGEVLDVPEGESVIATAEAREGYLFDGWYISYGAADAAPTFASHDQTYTFAPVADCTVTARFQRLCKVSVVAEPVDQLAGKYTVTGDGYCVSGKPVTLSVKLSDDVRDKFTFKGWYLGDSGVPMGTDPDHLELTPEQDTMVRAVFVPKRYRISVETDSHLVERGTVEIEGHPGADAVMVEYGSAVTIEAKPNEGFRFAHWKDGKRKKHPEQQLTVRVTEDQTYKAVFKGAEPEVVIAADSWLGGTVTCNGIEVTPTTDSFSLGQTLHLKAEPKTGYFFWGWYVNGIFTSLDMECDVVAKGLTAKSERCTVTAAFKPYEVVCLPVASPADGGSVRASRVFAERGAEVDLKAQASPGYEFAGWYSAAGELESFEPEFTCRLMRSHVHVAHFEERSYEVSAVPAVADADGNLVENRSAGWVEGAGTVGAGYSATLSAHALSGYTFEYWVDAKGNVVSRDADYRFVPSSDVKLSAVFAAKQFTVNVSAGEGYGSATGSGTYAAGEVACVSAIPDAGAHFIGWFSGGACLSTDATYRFQVSADIDLEAVFGMGSFTVSTIASPTEAGYVSGFGGFDEGQRTTLSATAKPGFTFDCWRDAQGAQVSGLPECTVTVTSDAAYTACFTRNSYGVTLSSNVEGVGELSGEGVYEFGQVVHIQARQTDDRRFVGWQLVGADGSKAHFADDADTWFVLDEDLVEALDDSVLELEAQFADPYEVAVKATPVVKGKSTNRRCRVQGTGAYEAGETVTLNAVAGLGYRFVGWTSDQEGHAVVSTDEVLSFEAKSDVMYYAQFEADGQVTITASQSSILRGKAFLTSGNGLTSATKTCDKGDPFVAMAIPWSTYRFSHWIDDAGAILSYNAVYVGIAQQDMQLTAVFYDAGFDLQVDTYPASAGFSTVVPFTGDGYLTATWMVTIPFPGWRFRYWIDERGAPVGFSPIIVRPAVANKTYTAYYVRDSWDVVAVDPRDGGYIYGSSENDEWGCALVDKVENGSSCTLRAVPDEGYVFDGWYSIGKDGAAGSRPVSTDAAWTFTPEDDVTVTARFAEAPKFEVKASAISGTVDPVSAAVPQGGSASFTATPYDGCYLERATVADVRDGSIADSVELDIADYQGGSYCVTLNDIDVPQRLAFSFARAGQPVVKAQPQDVSVHEGEAVTLSIAADAAEEILAHEEVSCGAASSHELGYQWFRVTDGGEDVALEGETSPSLTFDRTSAADAGLYYCRVTQTYLGTVTFVDTDRAEVSIAKREDLAFNACGLPVATAHSDYAEAIKPATGGTAPYTYAVAPDSTLPEGLHLEVAEDGAMRITGTPESAGVFGFGIVCSDSAGQTRTARFALMVAPQKADMSFAEANFVYDGQPQGPELVGVPDGCAGFVKLSFTGTGDTRYSGSTAPADAGTYRVVARLAANGYVGRAVAEFAIAQKPVSFDIAAADCVYDGKAHGVQVDAHGLSEQDYSVTYEGADGTVYGPTSEAPRDSGSYVATACVTNPNLVGEQKASFAIAKAPQTITGPTSYSGVFGGPGIVLQNTAKTPVAFDLVQDADGDAPVSLQGCYATINAAGTARVIARAAESRNYLVADDVELTLSVAPAQLLVAVDDAERMEGESNPAFTSSLVSRASTDGVEVDYSCDADEKSPAGDYIINASVDDPNFAATIVPGTLTVKAKPEPDPGPGPVDPDNPDPINPPEPGPNPDPDPDNPDPGPTPDPDNPDPDPVDPPNPPEPGPGPDPDNPDPGPGPDPDNPEPGPGPEPGPDNPDNPEPGPGPGPEPGPGPSPDPGPVNPPAPGPDPDPPNPPDPGPGPGPGPNPGPDPVDPGKPDPGPGPSPDNPDGPDNPDNPDNPNGPDNPDNPDNPNGPGKPDNPDKPDPSDPSKPGSDPDNPGSDPDNPDDPNSGNSGSSDDSNGSGGSDSGSSDDPNNSGNPGDSDNPDGSNGSPSGSGSANASVAAALGQTGDAVAKTGAMATGVAALIAAAVAALAAALATRRRRR